MNSNLINTFGPSGALGQQVLSHPNKQACNIVFYSYFIRRLKNYLHKQYIPVNQGNGWACEQISKCFSRHDLWRLFGPIYVPILIKSYFSTRPYVILLSIFFENMRIWVHIFNIFHILKKQIWDIFLFERGGIWHREVYVHNQY